MDTFRTAFPRQLRFWAFHCIINALPSLGVASTIALFRESPVAITAMFSGIGTFIVLYATLTSLRGPLSNEGHLLARSLRLGAKIRAWICLVSLLPFLAGLRGLRHIPVNLIPDSYCDLAALIGACYATIPGFSMDALAYGVSKPTFFLIYLTTIFTGLILSFFLIMISFFALIFLQARDRRKFFAVADSP